MIFGVTDAAGLLARHGAIFGHMVLLTTVAAGSLLTSWAILGHVILLTTVAASSLFAIRAIFRKVILRFTDLASTSSLSALLCAVTNTMTILSAKVALDFGLLFLHLFLRACLRLVTNFAAIVAFVNSAIERNTGIGEASQVVLSRGRPLLDKSGTLGFVREEVADRILLADFALEVDVGPGITMVFLLW